MIHFAAHRSVPLAGACLLALGGGDAADARVAAR